MSDFDIRPATERDLDALYDCWHAFAVEMADMDPYNELADRDCRALQDEYRREALADDDRRVLVGPDETDAIAGDVPAGRGPPPPVFAPGARGNGRAPYGPPPPRGAGPPRRRRYPALARGRGGGCGRLSLSVNVDNERARAFYERRGFEPRRLKLDRLLE